MNRIFVSIFLILVTTLLVVDATTAPFEAIGWKSLGSARRIFPDAMHRLTLGLPIRNAQELQERFYAVSDPKSSAYGQYLTASELKALIGPEDHQINAVIEYLTLHAQAQNIEVLASGEYIAADLLYSTIESLFDVELHLWTHPLLKHEKHYRVAATALPRIPSQLQRLGVDLVSGLRELPLSWAQKRQISRASALQTAQSALQTAPSTAPVITDLLASQDRVFFTLTPTCPNGSPTRASVSSLCADQGSLILGFDVLLIDLATSERTYYFVDAAPAGSVEQFPAASIFCTAPAQSAPSSAATSCIVGVPATRFRTYAFEVTSAYPSALRSESSSFYNTTILASDWISPQLLHTLYSIPSGFQLPSASVSASLSPNRQAIASFDNQFWSSKDLSSYCTMLGIPCPKMTTVGINDPALPGDEAQLDVSMISATGVNIPTSFFSITGGWLIEWAAKVLSQPDNLFPLVNSISYSDNEADLAQQYGANWSSRVDADFQKIAVRGGSVVVAAGDAGATNIGHGASSCDVFMPQYPASSAFVTTVGATGLSPAAQPLCGSVSLSQPYGSVPCSSPLGEIVVAGSQGFVWTTGGGVSNQTQRPAWQQSAVQGYVDSLKSAGLLPPQNLWNAQGRFYPDISAIGSNLIIILDGELSISAGTSASTPIISGILATLNAVRLSQNMPALGFANPLLYQAASELPGSFNDITVGNNNCGDVLHPPHVLCCPNGWAATVGFDAASGLGTPNWAQLVQFITQKK